MTNYSDPYVDRFIRTVMRPLANSLVGMNAVIDISSAQWTNVLAKLTEDGVLDEDVLIGVSEVDGTGAPTVAQVKTVVTLLGQLNTAIDEKLDELSILHTRIDLPE